MRDKQTPSDHTEDGSTIRIMNTTTKTNAIAMDDQGPTSFKQARKKVIIRNIINATNKIASILI